MKESYQPTPFLEIQRSREILQCALFMKRDDLFPFTGGGNKARKITYILDDAFRKNADAVITTGGIQSNHARVVALAAAEKGMPCHLVLHGAPDDKRLYTGNHLLMHLAGAKIYIAAPEEISDTIEAVKEQCQKEKRRPYVIPGGGHCVAGSTAYFDAVHELKSQCDEIDWFPEWIIHASGTGTTQAGIVAGKQSLNWGTRVVGISVGRKNPRGRDVVLQAYKEICERQTLPCLENEIDFRDSWVGDGYEKATRRIFETIEWVCKTEGVVLDPTYTAKAFVAMLDMIASGEIQKGEKVLFWHTGGLLNLISSYPMWNGMVRK